MMADILGYGGLFLAAMAAGSILPMQSEAVLAGLILTDNYMIAALVMVATVGNVAGSTINWFLGGSIEHFKDRKWFPVKDAGLARAQAWYHRYGRWTLLLSWAPLVGDPLTVVAGFMREPIVPFLILVTIAKFVRYVMVAAITLNVAG